jgi:hypothetical protein
MTSAALFAPLVFWFANFLGDNAKYIVLLNYFGNLGSSPFPFKAAGMQFVPVSSLVTLGPVKQAKSATTVR